jgi:hypothetical protein
VAQIRSIGNGGRGTAGGAVGGGPIYDDGTPVYGTGIPRAPQFNFDIRNLIGFPVSTIIVGGWQWIMSVNNAADQPREQDLVFVPEKQGNKVAGEYGYDDAHDLKDGRGNGGVDIYKDRRKGGHYLWNGRKGGEKDKIEPKK